MRSPLPTEDLDLVLTLTASVWSRLRSARIFVTGGTGFVGSWLLEVIARANEVLGTGITTVVLSRDPAGAESRAPHLAGMPGMRFVRGDVRSFDVDLGTFDACIHAAADVSAMGRPDSQRDLFDALATGTARVLGACDRVHASHFLLASSGAVYGPQPHGVMHVAEGFNGAPGMLDLKAGYAHGKRAAEWLTAEYASRTGSTATIARMFALLGPNLPLDGSFAAGNFIRDGIAGRSIDILGDGRPLRSYLYIADACVWLLRILVEGRSGEAYNVGSEHAVTIASLARAVVRECGTDSPVRILGAADPARQHPPRYVPATGKAREALGLEEYTTLDQGLRKTIRWQRMATS